MSAHAGHLFFLLKPSTSKAQPLQPKKNPRAYPVLGITLPNKANHLQSMLNCMGKMGQMGKMTRVIHSAHLPCVLFAEASLKVEDNAGEPDDKAGRQDALHYV